MKNCTIFPTTNGWASARSTGDAFLTDTNCAIIVNQPIHNLSKVLINGDEIAITYFYEDQTPWISGHVSDLYVNGVKLQGLDITRYVLEYDVYQTRDIILKNGNDDPYAYIGNIVRNNTCYYKQNENVIYLVNDGFGQYNKGYNFSAMVTSAVYWLMAHSENVTAKDEKGVFHKVIFHTTEEIKKYSSIDPRDFTFRVYYTPLGESVALTVPKTEPQEHQFTIPVSQQQPIVSSQAYGKNLQSLANRTGVAVRIVKRKVYTLDQIRKLGSYWQETDKDGNRTGNIYTLTSQEIVLQGGYAICTERWSKNWMMQSEYVGINREFRSWNIPADIVQRNLHYQDYCYITSDKDFDKDGKFTKDCDLTDDAKKYVLHSLIGDGTGKTTECAVMWFYNRDHKDGRGVVLNCTAMGFGNSLVFSGKTKDNLSAGTQRVKSNDSDKEYQYCKDVFYCNEDGKMNYLFVQIASTIDKSSSPEALNGYPQSTEGSVNTPSGTLLFKSTSKPFNAQKDPAEQLNFTYQLHLVTHNSDLIIGAGWANNCPLVVDRPNAVKLKYWDLSQPLPKGMQTMSASWGEERTTPISPVKISEKDNSFTIDEMSCITDEHYNIIVAYNGDIEHKGDTHRFYLKYTHDYDKLTQEYNSLSKGRYKDATYNFNN